MKIIKEYNYDVAVIGGGVAGCAAALRAARDGKKVLLVEKTIQLGGLATIGLINLFVPMCNGRGTRIIRGMAEEFLQLSIRYGWDCIPEEWRNGEPGQGKTLQRMISRFSPAVFALALTEVLHDNGVTILFDTVLTDASYESGRITDITVYNKSGYSRIKARIYVDATGDADLCLRAGAPTVTRGNFHTYYPLTATLDTCRKAVEKGDIGLMTSNGLRWGGNATLLGANQPEGKPLWDGTDGEQVSAYLVEGQLQLLEQIKPDDRKSRELILPVMPQFRTTRCLVGNATLKESDVYQHNEDSICAINDFEYRDRLFEVPYGVMVKDGFDNLLAVGRCASGEGFGWDVLRVIPPAILTGQAAGAAAVQALNTGVSVTAVNVKELQNTLAAEDVMIHFDDALIPESFNKESVDVGEV